MMLHLFLVVNLFWRVLHAKAVENEFERVWKQTRVVFVVCRNTNMA